MEFEDMRRDVLAVLRDQGLQKEDKNKKIIELLNPIPKSKIIEWLQNAFLDTECSREVVDEVLKQSDNIETPIQELRRIQSRHNVVEREYLHKRANLKNEYLRDQKILRKQGWCHVLLNKMKSIEILANEITERDKDVLGFLLDIRCVPGRCDDEFKVEFLFGDNPYFKDSILSKTFRIVGKESPKVEQAIGMEIEWRAGKSLANSQSFFNFFGVLPDGTEEARIQMEHDYCIGSTIRDNMNFTNFPSWISGQDWIRVHPVCFSVEKYDVLREIFLRERAKLELTYKNLFRYLYTERFKIVNGAIEGNELNTERGLPGFWLKAMKNNNVLADQITEGDEGALMYLQDIRWRRLMSDGTGFQLKFIFADNPYFENPYLLIQYRGMKISASEIEWRKDQTLTLKVIEKPGKKGKPILKACDSFFNIFTSRSVPEISEDEPNPYSKARIQEIKGQIRYVIYIGKIIRDKIIPHALAWFTKEALQNAIKFYDLEDLYDDGFSADEDSDEDEEEDSDSDSDGLELRTRTDED